MLVFGAPGLAYTLLQEAAHDESLFTQGLILHREHFTESSGLYGRSFVRLYHAQTGQIQQEIKLPRKHFAEGLVRVDSLIYMLTWKAGILYVLNAETLKPRYQLRYKGEGWGLTFDGERLIMSDGTDKLYFRDKKSFNILETISVRRKLPDGSEKPVSWLNELEYANGSIWANVWHSSTLLRIDPKSGQVSGTVDLDDLVKLNFRRAGMTLNGIAYDSQRAAFWVTGKHWPKRYLIKITEQIPGEK